MFTQFIEGPIDDPRELRQQMDRWLQELADGANGWLGTTAGVAADGTAFVAARFESADAAQANSDRPEQSAWWAETEKVFTGPVSFADCDEVGLIRGGGSDDAGFVQVIRGQVNDLEAARELFTEEMPDDERPDVIGGLVGLEPDGAYTMVVYFSNEADARAGEAETADEELNARLDALHDRPPRYLDITDPWLVSP